VKRALKVRLAPRVRELLGRPGRKVRLALQELPEKPGLQVLG